MKHKKIRYEREGSVIDCLSQIQTFTTIIWSKKQNKRIHTAEH